ncbi:MAG: carbonic anhydrase [Candidatus Coatesbacteria bacterium]|jgi:carbonic anhydrase|nr:carbonic anhydrase [Candidatus Coatesbacteria bacterium]
MTTTALSPGEALFKLKEGHARSLSGERRYGSGTGPERLVELTQGQSPYATILTCADSRVPPEHIFDAGLGDLFVCRNAGNLLDSVTLGSIEYAAAHTGCPLLVVLGHTNCGALGAAVAAYRSPGSSESPSVDSIIHKLLPAVIATRPGDDNVNNWIDAAAMWNVKHSAFYATRRSAILHKLHKEGRFSVIGAFYNLATGQVDFLNNGD